MPSLTLRMPFLYRNWDEPLSAVLFTLNGARPSAGADITTHLSMVSVKLPWRSMNSYNFSELRWCNSNRSAKSCGILGRNFGCRYLGISAIAKKSSNDVRGIMMPGNVIKSGFSRITSCSLINRADGIGRVFHSNYICSRVTWRPKWLTNNWTSCSTARSCQQKINPH